MFHCAGTGAAIVWIVDKLSATNMNITNRGIVPLQVSSSGNALIKMYPHPPPPGTTWGYGGAFTSVLTTPWSPGVGYLIHERTRSPCTYQAQSTAIQCSPRVVLVYATSYRLSYSSVLPHSLDCRTRLCYLTHLTVVLVCATSLTRLSYSSVLPHALTRLSYSSVLPHSPDCRTRLCSLDCRTRLCYLTHQTVVLVCATSLTRLRTHLCYLTHQTAYSSVLPHSPDCVLICHSPDCVLIYATSLTRLRTRLCYLTHQTVVLVCATSLTRLRTRLCYLTHQTAYSSVLPHSLDCRNRLCLWLPSKYLLVWGRTVVLYAFPLPLS